MAEPSDLDVRIRLTAGCQVRSGPNGTAVVGARLPVPLGPLAEEVQRALTRLGAQWLRPEDVLDLVTAEYSASLLLLLQSVAEGGYLRSRCSWPTGSIECSPDSYAVDRARRRAAGGAHRLSGYAALLPDADGWVLEVPISGTRIRVLGDAADEVLRSTHSAQESQPSPEAELVRSVLCDTKALISTDEVDPAEVELWERHDLFFHSHSRPGRFEADYGGTFRYGREAPQSRPLPQRTLDTQVLPTPGDLSMPLGEVLQRRESKRKPTKPLTLSQLSDFLWHSAGVRRAEPDSPNGPERRPYPGGGARYELEVYLVVDRVVDLDRGLYRYDPFEHGLEQWPVGQLPYQRLLRDAMTYANTTEPPNVLLVLAARFPDVAFKYESLAYALVLKDVGVLMAHFYLVATALGVSPCALGTGNSEVFHAATGLDRLQQAPVGDFMLSG